MKIHRFYYIFGDTSKQTCSDNSLVKQIRGVLRIQEGEEIIFTNGKGEDIRVQITSFGPKSFDFLVLEKISKTISVSREVVLYCSILKRDNFEWVVQKSVELGISRIIPVVTERTIKKKINIPRLQKIVIEAMEQSGRSFLPEVREPMIFSDTLLHSKDNNQQTVFLHFDGQDISQYKKPEKSVGIFVGPEGGWGDKEVELARDADLDFCSLGMSTLRAETAAVVSVYEFAK